ncbi:MAG: hypothetical protein K2J92_07535 [Muribaculaceae bacterium]|nr:hypothetical protein [Bacteroides sp.]MDE6681180.1 hypothetical protein [Muribaculaceae bacterium]MDE6843652.1 hypothetical protein [Muribaculaceae bacterium]
MTDSNGLQLAHFTVPADYNANGNLGFGPGTDPGNGPGNWPGTNPGNGLGGGNNTTSILITCEGLTNGSAYTLKSGDSESNVTARLTGNNGGSGWPR